MAFRLSKKGIAILIILGLLIFGGATGYLVWTVYYQDNLAPIDSDAGQSGCNQYLEKKKCEENCSPLKGSPAKSYECVWRDNGCKDGNKTCGGSGGGGHVCDNMKVSTKENPTTKACNLGSPPVCQKSVSAPYGNTGYSCICVDLSGNTCNTVTQCNTLDLKACPRGDSSTEPAGSCPVVGNCANLKQGIYYMHVCEGMSIADAKSKGCNRSDAQQIIVPAGGKTVCSPVGAGNWCGAVQLDSIDYNADQGLGCYISWYFPCDGDKPDDDEPPVTPPVTVTNPPACTSLAVDLLPQTQSTSNPIVVPSSGGSLTATLKASDPDGTPKKLRICYSVRGQSVQFYKTMSNWVCSEKANAATMSVTATSDAMITAIASATNLTTAQIEAAGITYMSEVYDNADSKICTSNPGYATGSTSVIQGTSTPCGGACKGSLTFAEAPPACGDGILDPGEVCDPGATPGTPANSCTVGACSTQCTCPTLDPGFNIQKVPVQQCIEGKETYADVRYTIVVTNNGTTVGNLSQVTDDLDPKVNEDWIIDSSITPSAGVAVANGQIIWNLDTASQTFDPGESMTFTYVIRIPQASFGNYRNVVTGIVTDEGEENVTTEAVIDVSCLPGTGLFDSTMARIALAGVLLITGAYFAQSGRFDGVAFNLFTNTGQVEKKRSKFEKSI